ncbi:thiol-disulfide oxidoreductase [Paenibacillus sp. MY03]|jgi:peroxiredoxin|uniref:Thiol-disulfide oxidoreductase n=1 Tax=Paenibacillus agaridevorans TaxID=171404 RepID=A0A2R5EZE8_9BACL|nr:MULTISPECIES: redoxin domain-containing protein [Paenibacillus]OUS77410.1 thiol-disulfide oxidoreductase [Paenibacillus sp. MY03]GBG12072.1 thiol-disulfide oxidoreductase [Paenibacillus agaridevorans]
MAKTKKSRKMMQVVILAAVLIVGGYAIGTTLFAERGSGFLKPGERPPEFSLANMEGGVTSLSDYAGKPVVINFWGTFCEPCVKEMPEFERQYKKWQDKDLTILAINLSEDTLTVKNFLNRFNLSYPILRDEARKTERNFALRQYPTTFFVKADGTLMEAVVGGMTEEDIDKRIVRLLQL